MKSSAQRLDDVIPLQPPVGQRTLEGTHVARTSRPDAGPGVGDLLGPWSQPVELVALCEALRAGIDILPAAGEFGRRCCGLLVEDEIKECLRAVLGHYQPIGLDHGTVIDAALQAFARQTDAYRLSEMLIDPLSGLDSEARFLDQLWHAARLGQTIHLVVLSWVDAANPPSWERRLRAGVAWRTRQESEGLVLLSSGALVARTASEAAAQQCLSEITGRIPELCGRLVSFPTPIASMADLTWQLTGAVTAPGATTNNEVVETDSGDSHADA